MLFYLIFVVDDAAGEGQPRFEERAHQSIGASQLKSEDKHSVRVFAAPTESDERKIADAKRSTILKAQPGFV
jgi:hypothetical protein